MRKSRALPFVLAAIVSLPGFMAGHLLREGELVRALEVAVLGLLVVLLAAMIMRTRSVVLGPAERTSRDARRDARRDHER